MKKPVKEAIASKKRLTLSQVRAKHGDMIAHYVELYHAYVNASVYVMESAKGNYRDRLSQAKAYRTLARYAVLFACGMHPWAGQAHCSLAAFKRAMMECNPDSCGIAAQRVFITHDSQCFGYRTAREAREVKARLGLPIAPRLYREHTGTAPRWMEVAQGVAQV